MVGGGRGMPRWARSEGVKRSWAFLEMPRNCRILSSSKLDDPRPTFFSRSRLAVGLALLESGLFWEDLRGEHMLDDFVEKI